MKNFFLALIIIIANTVLAQAPNDDCSNATPLGTLPQPANCVSGSTVVNGTSVTQGTDNVGATPENPYVILTGCGMASPANSVWYSFTAPTNGYGVNISVTNGGSAMSTPNIALWRGSNCNSLTGQACIVGSGGSATLSIGAGIIPNQTYYIQVSGGTGQSGTFTLSVNAFQDCNDCLRQSTLTVSPLPVNGTYQPGQTVSFCYKINRWVQIQNNWLHGVQLAFGPGWDLTSLTTNPPPTYLSVASNFGGGSPSTCGSWSYYPNGITSGNNNTPWPPGFYFNGNYTTNISGNITGCASANDGNPGNNYGDGYSSWGTVIVPTGNNWNFCWTIKVSDNCSPNLPLNVGVTTTSDGESGAWDSPGCSNDATTSFNAVIACCPPIMTSTNVSCFGGNNGTATATPVTGSIGPFIYSWTGPNGYTNSVTNIAGAHTISNLLAGTYTVTVTDANNCSSTQTVTITEPAETIISSSGATICEGNSTQLTASCTGNCTGITYSWAQSSGLSSTTGTTVTASPTSNTTYTITGTTSGNCSGTITATVTVNPNHTITAASNQTVCVDNAITPITMTLGGGATGATVGGLPPGVTSSVSNGVVTISGAPTSAAGSPYNYTVTTTGNSCTIATVSGTITIGTIQTPTIDTTAATCSSNGTATITNYDPTLNLTYTFTPTNPTVGTGGTISGLSPGISYTVIAGNGSCTSTPSAPFTIDAQLTPTPVPTITITPATCSAAGTATISNYVGTQTYTFNPATAGIAIGANGLISGLVTATNYTITANNGSCPSTSSTFSIAEQLSPPPVPTISINPASCSAAGSATITNYVSSLIYTFTPTNPTVGSGGSISGLTPGTSYTVTAGNSFCTSAASNSFIIADQLTPTPVPTITIVPATCSAAGTATISNYIGTQTYTFNPATAGITIGANGLISGLAAATNYTITANNGSCPSTSLAFMIGAQLSTPATPTVTTNPATCLNNGTAIISNYNVSLTYTFTPTGPTVGAGGTISGMIPGTSYTVTAGNSTCTSTPSTPSTISSQIPFPPIPFTVDDPDGCVPHTTTLSATSVPGIQYQWTANGNIIGTGASLTSVFSNTGYYDIQLTISNAQGCTASSSETDFIYVEANPVAAFTPNPNTFNSNSQSVVFTNSSTGAETYSWDFGNLSTSTEVNPVHFYTNIQGGVVVTLTATSNLGCTDQATYVIGFKEETIFYVPNSFTPDQDEFNQTWGPVFTQGFDPFNFDLYVFNRWGEIIWESHDAEARWDGTYGKKGKDCPDGVYTWKISYKPKETDEKINVYGSIRLIR